MPDRLLVVGLDAVESPVLQSMIAAGEAPNLAALSADGHDASIEPGCMSLLPGAIWQDLVTGRSAGAHGDFYPRRLHTGESTIRPIDPLVHAGTYLWDRAAGAGLRSIVVDVPLVPPYDAGPNVTLVAEWSVHDNVYQRGTHPEELQARLEAEFGVQPWDRCDHAHDGSAESHRRLRDRLLDQIDVKCELVLRLADAQPWDLLFVGFSDGHCAGHQLWHVDDPYDLRGPVAEVYRALDEAIGRIRDGLGPDVPTIVFTSHGMAPYVGGPQLLPVLLRERGSGDPRRIPSWVRPLLPVHRIQQVFARFPALLHRVASTGVMDTGLGAGTQAMAVPNNRVGAIRLNVVDREPDGAVRPEEVGDTLADLEADLLALRLAGTDEPVVRECLRPVDVYGPDHHPDLPDLLVVFRRDLGLIETVTHPTLGEIHVPVNQPDYPRTGDHTASSRVWSDLDLGPAGLRDSTDLAPAILGVLGVDHDLAEAAR